MKKTLDILKDRNFLGGFVCLLVGAVISWYTLGIRLGWLYTLFGGFLGATLGYYHLKIWLYTKAKCKKAWASCSLPKIKREKKLAVVVTQRMHKKQARLSLFAEVQFLRGIALVAGLVLAVLIGYTPIALTGHWNGWIWCIWAIGSLLITCAALSSYLQTDPRKRGKFRLGRSELVMLGRRNFLLRATRIVTAMTVETALFLLPFFAACFLVWAVGIAVGFVVLVGFTSVYGIWVMLLRLLGLAFTRSGHWLSFAVGSSVLFISLWLWPWNGNEGLGFVLCVSAIKGLVAGVASMYARRLMIFLNGRFNWNLNPLDIPFFETACDRGQVLIDRTIEAIGDRLKRTRKKLSLSPISTFE